MATTTALHDSMLDSVTDSYTSTEYGEENNSTGTNFTSAGLNQDGGSSSTAFTNVTERHITAEEQHLFYQILFVVNMIVPPVIISIGVIGNILSFLVLRKPKYAKQSTCVYMRALTFFDSFTLLVYGFQRYLLKCFPSMFWKNGDIFCKEFIFAAYLSMSNSHWSLVLMTVDRFIAVRFPLKSAALCTTNKAKKCIVSMAVFFVLFNSQQFLRVAEPTANVLKFKCPFDYTILNPAYELIFQHLLTYLVFYAPLFSLLVLNVLIVYNVTKSSKNKKRLGLSETIRADSVRRSRQGQDRQITMMLLLVTWVFTVAVTPFTVDHFFWDVAMPHLERDPYLRELRHVLYEIALTSVTINPAINFYLYCLGCKKFRDDLKSLLRIKQCCRRIKEFEQNSRNSISQGVDSNFDTNDTVETDSITTRL